MEKYNNESSLNLIEKYNFRNIHFILYSKGWLNLTDEKSKVLPADEAFLKNLRLVLELDGYGMMCFNNLEDIANILMLNFDRYIEWAQNNGIHFITHADLYFKIRYYIRIGCEYFTAVVRALREFYAWHCDQAPLPIKNLYDKKLYKFGLSNKRKHGETYKEMNMKYLKVINH